MASAPPPCKYTASTNLLECVEGAAQSGNCYDNYYPGVPTWTVAGLPAGVHWSYNPNPAISTTCSSTFSIDAPVGTYVVTECAVFPRSAQYPNGVSDCSSTNLRIESSLYLDVVVTGHVSPITSGATTRGILATPVDRCVTTYFCCYAKLNAGPQNNDVADPRSPMQTFIAANCYGGDALSKNSVTFNAYPYYATAAGQTNAPQSRTVDAGTCAFVKNITFGTYCETPRANALLVTGRSEISRPSGTVVDLAGHSDTSELIGELDLNDKIVNYPQVNVATSGYGPGIVPFPKGPFLNCLKASAANPPCTKANGKTFKDSLIIYYQSLGWAIPAGAQSTPAFYDAHHIQPSAWGGTDSSSNGVFLTNSKSTNDHQIFTTWWCSFSLPSASAPANCSTIE